MSEPHATVAPDRSLSVEAAGRLKAELLEALSRSESVTADLSKVEEIDLAGIVVLYAASREAEAVGKSFHLCGEVQPAVAQAFEVGGFCHEAASTGEELEAQLLDFRSQGQHDDK